MSKFAFDEEKTLDNMAFASSVDLEHGLVTLYACLCVGSDQEPHASHGGQLSLDVNEILDAARSLNDQSVGCHYLPAAVGIDPFIILHLAQLLMSQGLREDPDGD